MQSQPIPITRVAGIALPLTRLEMDVLDERGPGMWRKHEALGWHFARWRVAKRLGITNDQVREVEARARAKLRSARPVIEPPEDRSSEVGRKLWRLSRLEHYALVGVYEHDDGRDDDFATAEDDHRDVAYDREHLLPEGLLSYASVLRWRIRERIETGEEPSLTELERRRFQREKALLTLWGEMVNLPAVDLSGDAYPTRLPIDQAEAHLRWLSEELHELRTRAAARLGRSPTARGPIA